MSWEKFIGLFLGFSMLCTGLCAQDRLTFQGQLSGYTHFNGSNTFPWWNGVRYIPQANYAVQLQEGRQIDFEASGNLFGSLGLKDLEHVSTQGRIKPYRLWMRYSTKQLEIRGGLQKINFGSASILRPLMWFDQMDPRDPLQLTDGVWGVLGRYYTLDNITVWGWMLYGNNNPKGWEITGSHRRVPEAGGRLQIPAGTGEAAFSYHYRTADTRKLADEALQFEKVPEHRLGLDVRFDRIVGYWAEASWKTMGKAMAVLTNQKIINVGMDYTFGIGNGLYVILEQLVASYDEKAFTFSDPVTFSLLNASYPMGLFDNIGYILYYDWNSHSAYNFINWHRQFNRLAIHFMGYWNPGSYQIPTVTTSEMLFGGAGIQVMLVFNH